MHIRTVDINGWFNVNCNRNYLGACLRSVRYFQACFLVWCCIVRPNHVTVQYLLRWTYPFPLLLFIPLIQWKLHQRRSEQNRQDDKWLWPQHSRVQAGNVQAQSTAHLTWMHPFLHGFEGHHFSLKLSCQLGHPNHHLHIILRHLFPRW